MSRSEAGSPAPVRGRVRAVLEVALVAGRLGLTSFGGPIAHIGYFRAEYVARRRWLEEKEFASLVGLCQLLPGPASSQLGFAIGLRRAGLLGGLAAWLAFTAPSAVALIALAGVFRTHDVAGAGWVQGLKVVAVAVVAHAVWSMWRTLVTGLGLAALALGAAAAVLLWVDPLAQVVVIAAGGALGWRFLTVAPGALQGLPRFGVRRGVAGAALALFASLLLVLPLAARTTDSHPVDFVEGFYRSGALVFGGGHVVLPLLESQVVPPGWVSEEDFLAGYGAAQAVPGPLFTFAGYLGAVAEPAPNGVPGGTLALLAIFLPGLLLVVGVAPFWDALRGRTEVLAALAGVNAAVVGLLLAALYRPVFTSAVDTWLDLVLAALALAALALRAPPWTVVLACAAAGQLLL